MDWYYIIAFSMGGALLLLTTLSILFVSFIPIVDKWNKRYLIVLSSLMSICVLTCFIEALIYGDPNPDLTALEKGLVFFEFFFITLIITMPSIFLSHYAGEKLKEGLLSKLAIVFALTHLALLLIAQTTDIFYYFTPNNEYERGYLFPLLVSPLIVVLLFDLIGVFIIRKKLSKRYFISFLIYLPPMIITTILHMFFSFEIFVVLSMGLWAITTLVLVLQDNMTQYAKHQQEIANQKANILILQMRPHFVYNTMTSIYYLCDQDPNKAKQVTLDFTTYLRKNFAAIASEETISFLEELEHTRAYLAVEQAQFEDSLFVDFDTPYTSFKLPPLTLQPIVENAVKHGMTSSNDPIHISVKTRKTENTIEIIVEDDGPGYKPKDDNEPHIALNNIRQRLEMMCKGKLEILSGDKKGTLVKIIIPFNE